MNKSMSQEACEFGIYMNPGELVNLCTFFIYKQTSKCTSYIFKLYFENNFKN